MYERIGTLRKFLERVGLLNLLDYEERELGALPSFCMGDFSPWRLDELLAVRRQHPEYHIVTGVGSKAFINAFVPGNVVGYFLAEGDANPRLVFDPLKQLDAFYLKALNSVRNKRSA